MIDRKQLMIGNYVMLGDRIHVVDEIRTGNIVGRWINTNDGKYSDYKVSMIEEFYPIPLTEEILLKCGFGRRGGTFYLIIQTGAATHSIYIEYVFSGDTGYGDMWIGKETGQTKKIFLNTKYLHELQNLFFAITKKELEYE